MTSPAASGPGVPTAELELPDGWPRSYTVVGVGGVGGLYGGLLAGSGRTVRFLARSDAAHLREHGLVVESPLGDVGLTEVEVYAVADEVPASDVVVLATKTTENEAVLPTLAALVRPDTTLLVLQNGLDVEAPFAEALGITVLGGLCFVCSSREGPGHIRHVDYGAVTVGEHRPDGAAAGVTPRVAALVADLEGAGIPVRTAEDLEGARWKKLTWNVPYNGLSVVLDAGTDELMADPAARALVRELMVEVQAASVACGHGFDLAFVEQMLTDTDAMTPYAPSMKLDFDARRPLELDAIYRAPVQRAAEAGAPMRRVEALWRELTFLDGRNRARQP